MGSSMKSSGFLLTAHAICLVMFAVFVEYDPAIAPTNNSTKTLEASHQSVNNFNDLYSIYMNVHFLVIFGIGMLLTFLKHYSYSSVSYAFLLACYVIEWSLLVNGWFGFIGTSTRAIYINTKSLLNADFAGATILITFCAVLGVTSPVQLLVMATFEVVFYNVSSWIGYVLLEVVDVAGSIFIHAFAALFGIAVARVLYQESHGKSNKEGSTYQSDLTCMIGTLVLWIYWPSFNGSAASGIARQRAVVNTVLSLTGCTITTFALSSIFNKKNKFEMMHVLNSSLAGGVAVGAVADLVIHPVGALACGSMASLVCCAGFSFLQPVLLRYKLHDTCGVLNLHVLCGALSAFASSILLAMATPEIYQEGYTEFIRAGRTPAMQAVFQMFGLLASSVVALVGGTVTGLIMKLPVWDNLEAVELYDDAPFWEVDDISYSSVSGEIVEAKETCKLEDMH